MSSTILSPRNALLGVVGVLACAFLTAGCEVSTGRPTAYGGAETELVYTDTVPINIETYPREEYEGTTVYLVDGRWYRRSGDRWQNYRTEPTELGRRRAALQRRPPAQRAPRAVERSEPRAPHAEERNERR